VTNRLRVVVVGGSLGGLFAANMLHRANCDVLVYERVPEELAGRGAGIVTHDELHDALRVSGVTVDDSLGIRIPGRRAIAPSGQVTAAYSLPQIVTSWGHLHRLLREAFPKERFMGGHEVIAIEPGTDTTCVRFANGASSSASLVIAADGVRSTIRAQLFPDDKPRYAGYVGWRGMMEESEFSTRAHAELFHDLTFCLLNGEQFLGYPVAGPEDGLMPGKRRYNWVWYRPAAEDGALQDLLTDTSGKRHPDGIPPQLIRPEHVAALRRDAVRLVSPEFAEVAARTKQPFFQPIVDLESSKIVAPGVALIGDAAFVARPHCGMGVTKAAGDAMALTRAIRTNPGDLGRALQAYENERLQFGRFIVDHARRLGSFMRAGQMTSEQRRLHDRYSQGEAVITEFALPPLTSPHPA